MNYLKMLGIFIDSNIVTGISDKKLKKFVGMSGHELNTFEDIMKYLTDFNSGSDMDIGTVQGFIESQPKSIEIFTRK